MELKALQLIYCPSIDKIRLILNGIESRLLQEIPFLIGNYLLILNGIESHRNLQHKNRPRWHLVNPQWN